MNLGYKCMGCNQLFKGDEDGIKYCLLCGGELKLEVMTTDTYEKSISLLEAKQKKKDSKAAERKPLSISVDMNTDKLQLKLRAIAKHAEALAKELDKIDNAWQCDCGSFAYVDLYHDNTVVERTCSECNGRYAYPNNDDLPTRLEGSD